MTATARVLRTKPRDDAPPPGQPPSFEEFVHARSAALFRTAYLLTGSGPDAEDLLQSSLVKVYVAWARASAADSVEAYARRVLVNTYISSRRPLRVVRERGVDEPPDAPAIPGREPEQRLLLWPHVESLAPRQRAVVVLRYYEDLSEREIAAVLGCAPGTVKAAASAALRNLRRALTLEEKDD